MNSDTVRQDFEETILALERDARSRSASGYDVSHIDNSIAIAKGQLALIYELREARYALEGIRDDTYNMNTRR